MAFSVNPMTSSPQAGDSTTPTVTATQAQQDKNMFLQLLVAQLKNQDPTNPTDSSTFVTQLCQYNQLETSVNMETDISAMRLDMDTVAGNGTAASSNS
jgi:flagellar basal-body rod modification protein FlgD